MIAISKFVLKSRDYDFWTNLVQKRFQSLQIAIISGPNWERLQSYMVRLGIDIVIIFGPLFYEDCNHIWPK